MKISLRWVFDHLQAPWNSISVKELVQRFSSSVVEVESYQYHTLNLDNFTMAIVSEITSSAIHCFSVEFKKSFILPFRVDAAKYHAYLINVVNAEPQWATVKDMGGLKENLLPSVFCSEKEQAGSWKDAIEIDDYILTISNTSITHRPDLWGHRGIAREIGTLYNINLVDEELLFAKPSLTDSQQEFHATSAFPFSARIANTNLCDRFALAYLPQVSNKPSIIPILIRLARIDSKPINALVDLTNYVMFDLSQPLHAFDAKKVEDRISVEEILSPKSITLLDGTSPELPLGALVIHDAQNVLSLAGIMGGAESGITSSTTSILLESAHFNPSSIRTTSQTLHVRTEASARFEKGLDPAQNLSALYRIMHLMAHYGIASLASCHIVSLGNIPKPTTINLTHIYLERLLGISLPPSFVVDTLERLGFSIAVHNETYRVSVPTFRQKDIQIPADLVEEIARFFGLENFSLKLPVIATQAKSLEHHRALRTIRLHSADVGRAHEVINYPLLEESWLAKICWNPAHLLTLKNPVSQEARTLTSSLIPLLFQAVVNNSSGQEHQLHFFEINPIWTYHNNRVEEHIMYAGVFYDATGSTDFYQEKKFLTELCSLIRRSLLWQKPDHQIEPWYHPHKTAALMADKKIIGYAGMAHPTFLQRILPGSAFLFELNLGELLSIQPSHLHYTPLSKYPDSWLDVSMLAPYSLTVTMIEEALKKIDDRIVTIELSDMFFKSEWQDKRSLTFRFVIRDHTKTLTKQEIQQIHTAITHMLTGYGAVIR